MMLAVENHYVLPSSVPTAAVYLMAAVAAAAWVGSHFVMRSVANRWIALLLLCGRSLVGFGALLALFQALRRSVVLATNWWIWPVALGGAVCVEVLLTLYALERRTVSRQAGLALAAMRVAVVLLVIAMLTQPVWTMDRTRKVPRHLAILLDNSASMHVPETQLTAAEKVRLAEMLSIEQRPYQLDRALQKIKEVRQELVAQHDWLTLLGEAKGEIRARQLSDRCTGMQKALQQADKTLAGQIEAVGKPLTGKLKLDPHTLSELSDVKAKLQVQVRQQLDEAIKITQRSDTPDLVRNYEKLKGLIGQAATQLAELEGKLSSAGQAMDGIFLASLPPDRQAKIDTLAGKTRYGLARDLLMHRPGKDPSQGSKGGKSECLLDQLKDEFEVKMYTFAASAQEVNLSDWKEGKLASLKPTPSTSPAAASSPATAPASTSPAATTLPAGAPATQATSQPAGEGLAAIAALPLSQQETNISAALEKVRTDMRDKGVRTVTEKRGRKVVQMVQDTRLSGIILLTDGRQNAGERADLIANDLGQQHVPVCSVVFGSDRPPRDAAIVSLDAPETVYAQDKVYVKAELKLDGLGGEGVRAILFDGKKAVDQTTVQVPQVERLRKQIQLSDEPKEPGLHYYRIELQAMEGEVFTTNNDYAFTVSVSNDQTKLLILDGRPRWEFRYLKNLFDTRDRSVRLQYVLFEPDRILDQPPRAEIPASASRPLDQTEATALPKDLSEWMKFDAIVLGDVPPNVLNTEAMESLRKFVFDRGGTLILIAGSNYMPHAYAGKGLEEMLPVVPGLPGAPAESGFRIALTAEGAENVIMRQAVDHQENLRIWNSLPEIYWRYPIREAKTGATVLAFSMPPAPGDFFAKAAAEAPDEESVKQVHQYERQHALITMQNVAMGKVMFLSFDHTWRLRYLVGDTYHHKFWGQVLRWATANKLPSGTDLVKIGTDRSRYPPRSKIGVRAKIVRPDFTPVKTDEVAVNVLSDGKLVLRRKLDYVEDSPGVYTGDLGELASGNYQVELDAPVAKSILARDNVEKVATGFSVDPAAPTEQIELAADRGLLARMANLSGGIMVDPPQVRDVLNVLRTSVPDVPDRPQLLLWDSWPLLVLMILIVTGEWLLRKKVGLA